LVKHIKPRNNDPKYEPQNDAEINSREDKHGLSIATIT
jgi:hypothetical protein